jgi:phosphatidylinositol alpha-1,6-mannosyltransferase
MKDVLMPRQKKIVFLTCNFPPEKGGISNYIYQIVRNLPEKSTKVIGLPSVDSKTFDSHQKFLIERLSLQCPIDANSPLFKALAPFYLWHLFFVRHEGIVLCDCAHHSLMLPAWCLQRLGWLPFGVFVHGTDVLQNQSRKYKSFYNRLLCSASILFANSRRTAKILMSLGVKKYKIHIVHPSVNQEKFKNTISRDEVLQRHNLVGKRILLTVGNLVERKGVDMVIRAFQTVIKHVPDAHYIVVGSGPCRQYLEALVRKFGLVGHVSFTGYVKDKELGSYFDASELFVMISRETNEGADIEGFGIVFLEASLFGKPVIAGQSGGIKDAVVHGKTGLLVDPYDDAKVADSIIELFDNPDVAKRMGAAGKLRVLNEFSGRKAADKVFNAYRQHCV